MAAGFAELCAASAKAQATSEALERSHKKLNPELDHAQRLDLLERFSGSLFCCPDHATEGFCPVGRIKALECLRDLAVQVFPGRPAVLLAMPLQSVEQVLRFLGDGSWLQQNCARWTLTTLAENLTKAGCCSVWGRKLHLLGLTQHLQAENAGPLRDDVLLWKAARTFLQELGGCPPRSPPALQLPATADVATADVLRWVEAQFVAKLYSCSEECLRSAAVLGQAASLQELYLSKACSPENLWFCEREGDSLHEVLQILGDEAGVAALGPAAGRLTRRAGDVGTAQTASFPAGARRRRAAGRGGE
eukprot:g63141.t1